jgi:hypothetical protein
LRYVGAILYFLRIIYAGDASQNWLIMKNGDQRV